MIHVVLGTRAQLVKMAPVLRRLDASGLDYRFVLTGQHRETIDALIADFGLRRPDARLCDGDDVASPAQTLLWLVRILGRCIAAPRSVFGPQPRGIVLVHGDTLSTLVGALLARIAGLRVAHVESGLRSFRRDMTESWGTRV